MSNFNRVILVGHLTRDPEMRYAPSGTPVATFGLAVNTRSGTGEQARDDVLFIDCVVFNRQAETATEYLKKGSGALIEGRLRFRSWETPEGQSRSKHEVLVDRVQFLPKPEGNGTTRRPTRSATPAPDSDEAYRITDEAPPLEDDDIPF